jgi:hypothetical protein
MAASRVGFDLNRIELHHTLGVKLDEQGRSAMPLRPDWEAAEPASSNGGSSARTPAGVS